MWRIKLFFKKFILILFICFLASMGLLFGTDYGYEFRVKVAKWLLTSDHSKFAKYPFLPMEKPDKLLNEIKKSC